MGVTPLHLQIAIHYHVSPEQWPMLHVPIHQQYADDLKAAGLLRLADGSGGGPFANYEKTDGLAVWIDAICSTPFPVKQWVMPEEYAPSEIEKASAEFRADIAETRARIRAGAREPGHRFKP